MIKKIENCIYCGEKMEDVKSAKRKFCNDKCRIYYGRESSRGTLVIPETAVKINDPVIPVAVAYLKPQPPIKIKSYLQRYEDCEFPAEYEELWEEILNDGNLTQKEKAIWRTKMGIK